MRLLNRGIWIDAITREIRGLEQIHSDLADGIARFEEERSDMFIELAATTQLMHNLI